MKNGVLWAPESESGLRIGLRAMILQMSEKSKDRNIGWLESLRELIFCHSEVIRTCCQNTFCPTPQASYRALSHPLIRDGRIVIYARSRCGPPGEVGDQME